MMLNRSSTFSSEGVEEAEEEEAAEEEEDELVVGVVEVVEAGNLGEGPLGSL